MYTICNTTQDDVLKAVKAMGKLGYKFHITQVGQQFYSSMAKDRTSVPERIDNRKYKHVVSISTCTLHKESYLCRNRKKSGAKS